MQSGCYLAGTLRDKTHPGDILANYPTYYLDSLPSAWKGALETLKLISLSLRDTTTGPNARYWITTNQFKKLVSNSNALGIYLGLIYEKAKTWDTVGNTPGPIRYSASLTLTDLLAKIATDSNYAPASNYITRVIERAEKLETLLANYKKATTDSLMFQQYYNYFTAVIDLLRQSSQISTIPSFRRVIGIDLAKDMKPYFDVASSASNLVLDISKRNYPAAIVEVTHIYDIVQAGFDATGSDAVVLRVHGKAAQQLKKANSLLQDLNASAAVAGSDSVRQALQKSIQKLIVSVNTLTDTVKVSPGNARANLFRYGSFMATMALAKNSEDVKNAIEAIALPSGSARIKRETPFNVSLNAYPGLFTGHETINGIASNKFINSFGVTAPLGVAVSVGSQRFFWIGEKGKGHWSYSLFVSLIDIGAAAAFRFGDDTTAQVPTIQLKDILAPGGYLSIGIPKCPLSVNLGAQMGPNLRKVYGLTEPHKINDFADRTYWRYSLAVCVDIPVFNFFTKTQ